MKGAPKESPETAKADIQNLLHAEGADSRLGWELRRRL
jgi:hypothetical protein